MANSPIYVPALRLKQGEYRALQRLAPDVADKILPRLVVPPPKEFDPEKQRLLTKEEIVYGTGRRISEHWSMREALLEPRFLFKDFGELESKEWLPRVFDVARDAGAMIIPVATLDDLLGLRRNAFMSILQSDCSAKIAIRLDSGEFNAELPKRLEMVLDSLGLASEECIILTDYSDSDFSDVGAVSDVMQAALEDLQVIGRWNRIVFQGTNYPEVNPAQPNEGQIVPRNEWLAWRRAVALDINTSSQLVFGDYCADCAKFDFRKRAGGIPIRHYRYATVDSWLVVRGVATGETSIAMRDVCGRILTSGLYAGRHFSAADNYIYLAAGGHVGPGNGSTWREINTLHHITRVVRDIGTVKGLTFADFVPRDIADQLQLI